MPRIGIAGSSGRVSGILNLTAFAIFKPNQPLSVADLKHTATMIGLDADRFNTCVDAHKYRAVVDADTRAGTEAGVTGTPAFFINGRLLSGAQPYEAFKRLIDEELELKKR